jgi:glycogen(starch) synthase
MRSGRKRLNEALRFKPTKTLILSNKFREHSTSMRRHVLLVGSYPPPYGGCSVHIMRLRDALSKLHRVEVIDLYGEKHENDESWLIRCGSRKPLNALRAVIALIRRPVPLVHFHVAAMNAFLLAAFPLLAALRPGTRKILTIHSGSFVKRFENGFAWRRTLLRCVLKRFDFIITVNDEQCRYLENTGIARDRICIIPAFLPPVARASARTRSALQELSKRERIIISSGYGLPYYGFQVIVSALESLQAGGDRSALVLCMYNSYDEAYVSDIERRFACGLPGLALRDLAPEEFAWLLERCDVYVRATDRDGDAVAIREAQFYGKPVIASDCVERPADVNLFKTNDVCSLANALSRSNLITSASGDADQAAGFTTLLSIYDEALTA